MKVKLSKTIQLDSAIVYLRLEKEVERMDIKEYLNGNPFTNSLIENRVKDYLRNIKIYDEKNQLTTLGNTVKDSGKLPIVEEGKYQIWFTRNDSFFGNKILYFRRLQPINNGGITNQIKLDKVGHFLLPTDENKFLKLKLVSDQVLGNLAETDYQLDFTWSWDHLEKSVFIFDGQLGKENEINLTPTPIPCNINIKSYIEKILPDWDNSKERYRIRFNETNSYSRNTFEVTSSVKWNSFEVKFDKLPIMPYNSEEAKKWRDWLILEKLKKEFYTPYDFESLVIETNEKDVFSSYANGLNTPKPRAFSDAIKKETIAFWHLNSPMDLNPNSKVKLSAKPIELRQDENISFAEIAAKLEIDKAEKDSILVYYDRFVISENQQKAVAAFMNVVDCKKTLITDLAPKENSSDYISKNHPQIKVKDFKSVLKLRNLPHDRYLICGNKAGLSIWAITNSIDYIRFYPTKDVITPETKGRIRQSVVFTPISKEMLDKELLNFINNELQNGK